jgi:hypothetical protein
LILLLALCVLSGLVWYHVLSRADSTAAADSPSSCPTAGATPVVTTSPRARGRVLPPPSQVSVIVLNSTHRNGLAGQVRDSLQTRGFNVTDAANDGKLFGGHGVIKGVGEIRFGPRGRAGARLLHYYLPGARLRGTSTAGSTVLVSLGARFRGLADGAAVHRALTKARVRLAVPTPSPSPSC